MNPLKLVLISGIILVALDFSYLTLIYKPMTDQIVNIQRVIMQVKPAGVVFCYIFMIFALYFFILKNRRTPGEAFLLGACINGIYESTNYAVLKKWGAPLAIVDTLWGGILYGTTTYLTQTLYPIL